MYRVYAGELCLPFKFYNITAAMLACLEYTKACVVDGETGEILVERD